MIELGCHDAGVTDAACQAYCAEVERLTQLRLADVKPGVDKIHVRPLPPDVGVTMSIADMQFVETANLNRDTILLAFGMSKFAVGVLDDVNRAVGEAAKAWFGETHTVPRLDRWRGMLNSDFGPQFGGLWTPDLDFVYSNPVPADREAARLDKTAEVANFVALVTLGVDAGEAAQLCGLPQLTMSGAPRPALDAGAMAMLAKRALAEIGA